MISRTLSETDHHGQQQVGLLDLLDLTTRPGW